MKKDIKILIFSLFFLNIVMLPLVNIYLFNNVKNEPSLNTSTFTNKTQENNTDLFKILIDINYKLDAMNQYLASHSTYQPTEILTDLKPHPVQHDELTLRDIRRNLINDMSRYDMNIATFLADPRLNSLPEQDKNEILTELTRRLDSGEIDKSRFLPGYKQK